MDNTRGTENHTIFGTCECECSVYFLIHSGNTLNHKCFYRVLNYTWSIFACTNPQFNNIAFQIQH